jgi:hypothetical protein
MVKFAHDCIEKIHEVTQELAGKLGEDTMELAMRVGVNSGSTTAGVLRYVAQNACLDLNTIPQCSAPKKCRPYTILNSSGEKGRFQLFGDTGMSLAKPLFFEARSVFMVGVSLGKMMPRLAY